MAYTDINSRAGKGSRLEHNVSTKKYREGYDKIFGKKRSKPAPAKPIELKIYKCTECEGYGELPQGKLTVPCRVCDGTGKLIESCE
jgi:DnaJ-class molecular chaperone